MVLAPQRATLGVSCASQAILGVTDITITDKTTMEDITCDTDSAVRRFPTIDDCDCKISVVTDPADLGYIKMLAAKAAHTPYAYVLTKGSKTFTIAAAYISDVAYTKGPKDVSRTDFTLAVSGGCVVS